MPRQPALTGNGGEDDVAHAGNNWSLLSDACANEGEHTCSIVDIS
jgi:hypothetical protein